MPGRLLVSVLLLTFGLCAGCGSSVGSVSGEVTWEGQPLEEGRIDFLPADGKGQPVGGVIAKGRYKVEGLVPGPKLVQITAVKKMQFPRTTQEMADAAAKGTAENSGPADLIPADAEGNNTTVEVTTGAQVFNFALKKKPT